MILILCFFTFLLVTVRQRNYRDALVCPITLYAMFYTICVFGAFLALDNRNELSERLIFYSLLSFIVVVLSYSFFERTKVSISYRKSNIEVDPKLLYILSLLVLGYFLYTFVTSTLPMFLRGVSTAELRRLHLTGDGSETNLLALIIDGVICSGLSMALSNIIILDWFTGRNRDVRLVAMNGLILIVRSLNGSDRLYFFDFVFLVFFAYMITNHRTLSIIESIRVKRKNKKMMILIASVAIFGILYMTNQRQSDTKLFDVIYSEFTCGFQIFDICIDKMDAAGIYTWGITSCAGIIILINLILAFLGLPQISLINEINKYDVPFWNVGGGHNNNGYLPYFAHFYLDMGVLGIVLGSIIFGAIMASVYKKVKYNDGTYNKCLYLFVILLIARCTLRWYFTRIDFIMAIVFTMFLYNWQFVLGKDRNGRKE